MKSAQTPISVSIVIPAYNEERHLAACLASIAEQTVRPYEVIVVDNNSTDHTVPIAQAFPFVRVVHESQQGIVYARNAGFNAARGTVIGRIDADSELTPTWVAHITKFYAASAHHNMAWTGSGNFYNVQFPRIVNWFYRSFIFDFNRAVSGGYTLWGSNMALPTKYWRQVAKHICLRTDIHEDLDIAMHLADVGCTVYYDRSLQTDTELRRVNTNHDQLRAYLSLWPRTLKVHHKKAWIVMWPISVAGLYALIYLLYSVTRGGRAIRRQLAAFVS